MRPLSVHGSNVGAAQPARRQVDQGVGAALRTRSLVAGTGQPAQRVDCRLHDRATLGIELTTNEEDTLGATIAGEPAPRMSTVVLVQHACGVDLQPCCGGQKPHLSRIDGLSRGNQRLLDDAGRLDPDVGRESHDQRGIGERHLATAETLGGQRQLLEDARHTHPLRRRRAGETARAAKPGLGVHRTLRLGAAVLVEARQPAGELRLESIDLPPERHELVADGVR